MRKLRFTVYLLIGLLALLPIYHLLASDSEAATPAAFNSALLLSRPQVQLSPDHLPLLDRTVIMTYTLGPNENLWSIQEKFCPDHKKACDVDAFSIRSSNDLDIVALKPGDTLKIPNHPGTIYEVKAGENLESIRTSYDRGRQHPEQFREEVLTANDYPLPDLKQPSHPFPEGLEIFLPKAWNLAGLYVPFGKGEKYRKTSGFGMRKHPVLGITRPHKGFDLARPYGSPAHPARSGVVTYAGWMGGYGNMIELRHVIKNKNGTHVLYTRYGHLSKILVHVGQHIPMYAKIGEVGSTGISTGPHLHFEVRDESGVARNPGTYLN